VRIALTFDAAVGVGGTGVVVGGTGVTVGGTGVGAGGTGVAVGVGAAHATSAMTQSASAQNTNNFVFIFSSVN
jgi:hypothetical protein